MSLENLPIYGREPWKPSSPNNGFVHIRHFPGVGHRPLSKTQGRGLSPERRNQHFKPGLHLSPIKVRKIRTNSVARETLDCGQSIATPPDPRISGVPNETDPTLAIFSDMSCEKENRTVQAPPGRQRLRSQFPTKARDAEPSSVTGWLVIAPSVNGRS
jgi:hypothetical protein